MKRIFTALVLIFALIFTAGCGAKTETDIAAKPEDTAGVYEQFITDEIAANITGGILNGRYDSLDRAALADAYKQVYADDYGMEAQSYEMEFAYVKSSMVLKTTLYFDGDQAIEYAVFYDDNGTLNYVNDFNTYYRTGATIGDDGVILTGGSSSAFSSGYSEYVIEDDGSIDFVLGNESYVGLTSAYIPSMALPVDLDGSLPEGYPDEASEEGSFTCNILTLNNPNVNAEYGSDEYNKAMDEYYAGLLYEVESPDGNGEIPEDFMSYYTEKGLTVLTKDDYDKTVSDRLSQFGITTAADSIQEPVYIPATSNPIEFEK